MTLDLVGDLGAADDGDEGLVGFGEGLAEVGELLLHQQAGGGLLTKWVMPSVEAWARWALPKASLT